jgi:hypothetical protein
MNESFPRQELKLRLKVVEQGLVFLFQRSNRGTDELFQVPQSWSSIHSLLYKLRNNQRYCAQDIPLLIWKQGEELHIKLQLPDSQVVEECAFSSEETGRILMILQKLPCLN